MTPSAGFLGRIRAAFIIAAVAMAVFGAASYFTIDRLVTFGHSVVRSNDRLLDLERAEFALGDAEGALREYVLTGAVSDRQRLDAALDDIDLLLLSLRRNRPGPEQARLEEMARQRVGVIREAAEIRSRGYADGAIGLLRSTRAERVAGELASALRAETVAAQEAWARSHSAPTVNWARGLVLGTALLLVAMFGWFVYVIRQYERERKGQQQRADAAEAMSRTITANMADGMITASADLQVLDCNESALHLLGYTREELVGRSLTTLIAPDAPEPGGADLLSRLLASPDAFKVSALPGLGLHKEGRLVPLRISVNDVRVGDQRQVAMLIQDMTQIQRATEALHASESQLRQIADALPVMIAEIDLEQRLRFHNRALDEFLGLTYRDVEGRTVREAFGEERYQDFLPHLERVLAGEVAQFERAETLPDGEVRHFHIQLLPRLGHRGNVVGCYGYGSDITPLKRIDRMKTEFVSIVSHELRTPLTSIRGSLGLIAGGVAGKLPEPMMNLVGIAKNNCDRLVRLINDILDIEKIESGKLSLRLQKLDMGALVRQTAAANEGFAGQHGVSVRFQGPEHPLLVQADSDRLVQVLTNLVSNAVKFSPRGGTVDVRVSEGISGIRVEVADQGPGIPPEFQERLFQKFSQADSSDTRSKGGTGLGLNISRTLVEKMGGHIGFRSPPGSGATFFIELPQWQELEAPTTPARPRVLVCEGDEREALNVRSVLAAAGFDADIAGDSEHALRLLDARRYDVLTLDPALEGCDEPAFVERLRRAPSSRPLPVVVIAERCQADRLRARISLAMALWLDRPLDPARLVQSLQEAIGGAAAGVPQILHLEDDADIQHIVSTMVRDCAACVSVSTLEAAREQLRLRHFDLILLDLDLGGACGWELLEDVERLEARPPVIVFSASDAEAAEGRQVEAMLIKSQTTEAELLDAIQRALPGPVATA